MVRKLPVIRPKPDGHADGNLIKNKLLLNLPDGECRKIIPHLVFLPLRTHDVLNEVGQPIKYCYFLNDGLASVLNVMEDGKSVEVGLSGVEGFVGAPLLVGFQSSPSRVIVQIEGTGFRIGGAALVELLPKCSILEKRLQRHSQVMAMQSAQVAACNRLHDVDERLARWLLMSQDRINSDRVPLTQEFLAHMLGTRRSSVTIAAGVLHKAGLITYTRGHVNIVNRPELENAACECYGAMVRLTAKWNKESN